MSSFTKIILLICGITVISFGLNKLSILVVREKADSQQNQSCNLSIEGICAYESLVRKGFPIAYEEHRAVTATQNNVIKEKETALLKINTPKFLLNWLVYICVIAIAFLGIKKYAHTRH